MIVDVDGTLADVAGLRHYVLDDPRRKDFTSFHAAASYVRPIELVASTVQALDAIGFTIVVLTSRKEQWRYRTRTWLTKWAIPFHALGMRAELDERRDDEVKRDLHRTMVADGYTPVLAIDDNPIVVALWQELQIPTVVVPGWTTPKEAIQQE